MATDSMCCGRSAAAGRGSRSSGKLSRGGAPQLPSLFLVEVVSADGRVQVTNGSVHDVAPPEVPAARLHDPGGPFTAAAAGDPGHSWRVLVRPAGGGRYGLVSELSIAANVIGIDEADLATALGSGLTIAQVALLHGVKVRRVVTALVSDVVAGIADEIRRGDLSADQVRWLVALATWRAEAQVTSALTLTL
jgi:hypothetical protein